MQNNQTDEPGENQASEIEQEDQEQGEEESSEEPAQQNDEGDTGINKLFDLMKADLGNKQTDEMKSFYEKMSKQIREMCAGGSDELDQQKQLNQTTLHNGISLLAAQNNNKAEGDDGEDQNNQQQKQGHLNQLFMLSLLQYQKQKILQYSEKVPAPSKPELNDTLKEESANESSNEEIVFDERIGEPCLVDEEANTMQDQGKAIKKRDAFSKTKIKCLLRPIDQTTSQYLLDKSSNNINPYVIVEAEAGTKVATLIEHMSSILFKEEVQKFVLRVHQTKFTNRRSCDKNLKVKDMLLAEDPDKLETALSDDKEIKLTIKYAIKENCDSDSPSKNEEGGQVSELEGCEVPSDLEEADLIQMFTDVMSILLFNNKDEQMDKYVGSVSEFDLKAKLPHPNDLLSKRRRKKKPNEQQQVTGKDNEKSEVSQMSQQQRRREAKIQAKQASKVRPLKERLAEYQESQQEKLKKVREKREINVQKFQIDKQSLLRDRIDIWCNGGDPDKQCMIEERRPLHGFTSLEEMINFRTNPYFDNLEKFINKY